MCARFEAAIIFCGVILLIKPVICHRMSFNSALRQPNELDAANKPTLSEDEISNALSELSVDELNALSQLMDVFSAHDTQLMGGIDQVQQSLEEQSRFKRESQQKKIQIPNVDEEYIKQLDESFPNVDDQSNQDDREAAHVRVKRK